MTQPTPRSILVTSALPNANGPIHLGHLLEHIQTDIWVRFQRMRGNTCFYVCADDTHGTATMLKAEQEGIPATELIDRIRLDHERAFQDFLISHDNYYSTHSSENRYYAEDIYLACRAAGQIAVKSVAQLYDPAKGLFLADRFIVGTCPRCRAANQYGDNCEACGATYAATDLIEARSAISGVAPVLRDSDHYFFRLSNFATFLREWTRSGTLQPQIVNKLGEWLDAGLQDWDISRDAPYFGFEIPDAHGKYFYVWLDAPIGYMASFRNLCDRTPGLEFDAFWKPDSKLEVHHFIGKDIINFHALFWPALLHCAGYRTPTSVHAHGFITVNGQKMSKSRGTFIDARTYLDHLDPEYLRYYFASKLSDGIDDIDFTWDDFVSKVNADLVGKLVNIASRCAGFINRNFGGELRGQVGEGALWNDLVAAGESIARCYETKEFSRALREIMGLADRANRFIDDAKPWVLIKQEGRLDDVHRICSDGLNLYRLLCGYLKPVLPGLAARSEEFLGIEPLRWADLSQPLTGHRIQSFKPLLTRAETAQVEAMLSASRPSTPPPAAANVHPEVAEQIEIDDFGRIDLRVARIHKAETVPGADKLLRLVLDLGFEQRTVFAGIRLAYAPEQLEGRLTVMVANLKPRKMKFGTSEGMVLAAGPGGEHLWLLQPDSGAEPGMKIS